MSHIINNEGPIPLSAQQLLPTYCSFIDQINAQVDVDVDVDVDSIIEHLSNLFDKNISFTVFQGKSSEGELYPDKESWLSYTIKTLTQFTTNLHLLSVPIWTVQDDSLNVEYSVQSSHINTSQNITIAAKYTAEIKKIENRWLIMNIQLRINHINS